MRIFIDYKLYKEIFSENIDEIKFKNYVYYKIGKNDLEDICLNLLEGDYLNFIKSIN